MRRAVALMLFGSVASFVSCAAPPPEKTAGSSERIMYGTPDTTHQAVVAVIDNQGQFFQSCTGTIVQVKGNVGYVLTAAHCCTDGVTPDTVLMGDDYQFPSKSFGVVAGSIAVHPGYNHAVPPTFDFCMLRIAGASANTPVIPVATPPDGVAVGSQVEFVGYGVSGTPAMPNDMNTLRRHRDGVLNDVKATTISYSEANGAGGPCSGDSGGPALMPTGVPPNQQKVVGVTSYGDQDCAISGTSGRVGVAQVYDNFILPYLNDQIINPVVDCNSCSQTTTSQGGACYNAALACFNDQACSNLNDCIGNCNGSQACVDGCVNQFQAGVAKLNAVYACICNTGCTTECAAECGSQPSCGLTASDPTCNTCLENSCCGEAQNCANNATCTSCLVANPPASCNNNAQYNALFACLDAKCGAQCGGSSSSSSSSGMASSSSSGNASSSSGGQGGGGQGGGGQGNGGGATGSGGGNIGEEGGCSMSQSSSSGATPAFLAIALGAALSLIRRRRAARRM